MRQILLALLLVVGATAVKANDNDSTTQKKTATLPSVMVKKLDGTPVNIQDYGKMGKITIISFWATWCGPCIKELDNISEIYEDWQTKYNVQLVAVTIDDSRNVPKVPTVVKGHGWDYTILSDENKDLARALNVNNPPQTILLDENGNIVYVHNGYVEGNEYELEEEIKKLVKK